MSILFNSNPDGTPDEKPSSSDEPEVVLRGERKFDFRLLNKRKPKFRSSKREVLIGGAEKASSITLKMCCPANLDIEDLLEVNPPPFSYKIDKLRYIIDLICTLPVYQREIWDLNNEDVIPYIPLSSQKLKVVIWNYQDYLRYLDNNEILECNDVYEVGVVSKGYRFCEKYLLEPFIEDRITDRKVVGAILNEKKERERLALEMYPHLREWFNQLEFDYEGALAKLLSKKPWCNPYDRLALERIRDKAWFFRLDNTAGRLHTNLTNVSKLVRPFLSYKGQSLVALDVANAQPFLATCLLCPDFYSESWIVNGPISIHSILTKPTLFGANPQLYREIFEPMAKFLKNRVNHSIHKPKIDDYSGWVAGGNFYEKCAEAFNIETGLATFNRDIMKKTMYIVFYGRNNTADPYKKIFKSLFPIHCKVFYGLKKKAHNHLPILLQAMEAHIVLDRIVGRIASERPDVPLFTIHDCVATIPEHVEYIKEVMLQELYQAVGIRPTLKPERWE